MAFLDMITFIDTKAVHITGVVGNHSRMSQKPRAKFAAGTSWDWLLFQMLERHFLPPIPYSSSLDTGSC